MTRRRTRLLASLTLLALVAGCTTPGETTESATSSAADPQPARGDPAGPTPESAPPQEESPRASAGRVSHARESGQVIFSAGTDTVNTGADRVFTFEARPNLTGLLLAVEWEAVTPAAEHLSVWVRVPVAEDDYVAQATEPVVAEASGTSPLRLVVEAAALEPEAVYEVWVSAGAPASAALAQPHVTHMAKFMDRDVDPEYAFPE